MNENIDLTKILKDCPKGTKLYSTVLGYVIFRNIIDNGAYPIVVSCKDGFKVLENFTADGKMILSHDRECTLFPSKDQRDWSKFAAPWYKKGKFDPKTLNAFDKVLVRDIGSEYWYCGFFSHIVVFDDVYRFNIGGVLYVMCIPYNDETKHLVGTKEEAPEYYRYWED